MLRTCRRVSCLQTATRLSETWTIQHPISYVACFAIFLQPPCDLESVRLGIGMASSSRQGASGLPGRPKGPPPPRRMTIPFAQQTPKPPPHPILKQASYPVYNLKWEKLKAILEKRFPGYTFTRRCVSRSGMYPLGRSTLTSPLPSPGQ